MAGMCHLQISSVKFSYLNVRSLHDNLGNKKAKKAFVVVGDLSTKTIQFF